MLSGNADGQDNKNQYYISNPGVNNLFYEGFRNLYRFEFNSCQEKVTILKGKHSDSPWGHILNAEYCWWMIITGDRRSELGDQLVKELGIAMKKAALLPEREAIFCKIIAYSLNSRYALYKGQYFKVISQLNEATGLINSGRKDIDSYEPFKLTQGLFDYFMAEAGERFGIFNPISLLGINADKERGLMYLRQISNSKDEILRTESRYFLMKIYSELESNFQFSCMYGEMLTSDYPTNLLFSFHYKVCGSDDKPISLRGASTQMNEAQRAYFFKLLH